MRQIGLICALALSVITGGFHMDWDPDRGPALPAFLRNHPSALVEVALVTGVIVPGDAAPPCPWPAEGQHPAAQVCAPSCESRLRRDEHAPCRSRDAALPPRRAGRGTGREGCVPECVHVERKLGGGVWREEGMQRSRRRAAREGEVSHVLYKGLWRGLIFGEESRALALLNGLERGRQSASIGE